MYNRGTLHVPRFFPEEEEAMKKLTINVTDEQNESLDQWSEVMGVTKNGLICLAIHEWLMRKSQESAASPTVTIQH